jgi:enamine deaminase RidA (YjgF/YER057c/UK114 family)
MLFLAGHTGQSAPDGTSNAANFDAQVAQTFRNIEATLKEAGGSLKDIVTMTAFIIDARWSTRFTELRHEIFGGKEFPASALITVAGFADPAMMVEVQSIAVLGDR